MPISDEALLQILFKHHEGKSVEFIMAEYGKAKRLYLEIEQGLTQKFPTTFAEMLEENPFLEEYSPDEEELPEPKKRFTKRSLKCVPQEAIKAETITCCLCNKPFKVLNSRHLKSHGISVEDYKKLCDYPATQLLMSKQEAKKAEKRGKELAKARAEKLAAKAAPEAAQAAQEAAPAAE